MPYVFIIAGAVILLTAINGTTGELGAMLKTDIFGTGGFMYWFIAIVIVGGIGYIKPLKPLSDIILVLLVLILFLSSKGGFFKQFTQATNTISQQSSAG